MLINATTKKYNETNKRKNDNPSGINFSVSSNAYLTALFTYY